MQTTSNTSLPKILETTEQILKHFQQTQEHRSKFRNFIHKSDPYSQINKTNLGTFSVSLVTTKTNWKHHEQTYPDHPQPLPLKPYLTILPMATPKILYETLAKLPYLTIDYAKTM